MTAFNKELASNKKKAQWNRILFRKEDCINYWIGYCIRDIPVYPIPLTICKGTCSEFEEKKAK